MKLTKTSAIEILGTLGVLFAANSLNLYVATAIISILTIVVYNVFPTDNVDAKPAITWISAITILGSIAGYFFDHPKEVVDVVNGVEVKHFAYIVPIAILTGIKSISVAFIRFYETSQASKN